jgi:hypothetical protein
VTPGDSGAGCLKGIGRFVRADILAQEDPLSCGPLIALASVEAWREVREAYWARVCPAFRGASSDQPWAPRPLIERPHVLLDADVVHVWLGVGLDDQLFLAWFLELAIVVGLDPHRICVIQFRRHPVTDEPVFHVGELPPEVAADHPPPEPLTSATIADLRAAWAALTASDPTSLLRYLEGHAGSAAPFHAAVATLLDRFPDRDTGLNRWELELLRGVPQATIDTGSLFSAFFDADRADLDRVGPLYLEDRLRRMGDPDAPEPLLRRVGGSEPFTGTLALTDAGRRVLQGQANAVDLIGLDDWVGGTHLHPADGRLWFRWQDSLVAGMKRTI